MSEKNPLVGILATALIVSLSINAMTGIYISKLSKDIKTLKSGGSVDGEEGASGPIQKDIKFAQFDTAFYKVEDCAIEQVECATIAEKVDYEFDIDADSSMDKLTVEIDKKGKKGVIFKINGSEFENGKDMKGAKFYLADLNKFDNTIEVVIYDEGEENNPHYMIYSKSGSRMKLLQDVEGPELFLDEIGKVVAVPNDAPKISPMVFGEYYEFENGKLKTQKLIATRIRTVEFSAEGELFVDELPGKKGKSSNKGNTNTNTNNTNGNAKNNTNTNANSNNNTNSNSNSNNSNGNNSSSHDFEDESKSDGVTLTAEDKFEIKAFTDDLEVEVDMKDGRHGYVIHNSESKK